jgi:hypothetical protein
MPTIPLFVLSWPFDAARAGPWEDTADRLPIAQVEMMHQGALLGPHRLWDPVHLEEQNTVLIRELK